MDPAKKLLEMTSMTIEFSDMSDFRPTEMTYNNVNIMSRFLNGILPSLKEIKFVPKCTNKSSLLKVDSDVVASLLRTVQAAVLHRRKIIINENIEIEYNRDPPPRLRRKSQTLAVTFVYGEPNRRLRNFLQQKYKKIYSVTKKL